MGTRLQRKKDWFDNEAFWRETYEYMFPKKRFADAFLEAEKIIELVKPKGRKVLDLCCGPGRFSIALAKKKYLVTGVDKSKFLLVKAKAKARATKSRIEWVESDMRDFVREEYFDLVLNMFTSFGYFEDQNEDMGVLRNILKSLKPGGTFLLDTIGKERLAKIFLPSNADVEEDGSILVQLREAVDDWTRMRNRWIVIRKGSAKEFHFEHTIYSGQELKDLMLRAGFSSVRLFGSLDGDSYGPNALRLVAVGKKGY